MAEKFFVIDGSAFAYRAYYAIRGLSTSKGTPTNAVYGFARVLLKILREYDPEYLAVTFDAPGKTFRDDMYPQYKATRQATPEDLIAQLPLIDKLLRALRIPVLRIQGVEADDVMGALARQAQQRGLDTVLVTGDKDALQLIDQDISVYDPHKGDEGAWYAEESVRERYGVPPERVTDTFALMGDASDNVPGVAGIGPKTARTLLERFGSLEGVYENLEQLKGKQRENLERDRDTAFLSRRLVTIKTDVPLELDVTDCKKTPFDKDEVIQTLSELEFESLVEQFLPDASAHENTEYVLILTADALEHAIDEMKASGVFAVDTETTSTDPMRAELVGISMSCRPGKAYYIPLGHAPEALLVDDPDDLFAERRIQPLPKEQALDLLRPLLENPAIGKVGHNIKYDLVVLRNAGIDLAGIAMDTMVASYLTNPSRLRHNLNEVSLQHLKRKTTPIVDLIGKGAKAITFDKVPVGKACRYACEDADVTWRLSQVFEGLLRERRLLSLFTDIELPLIDVLARMEMAGIAIDQRVFDELTREMKTRIKTLEKNIFEEVGESFQINSPKQLQRVLFDKLGLKPARRTKTGFSTDVDVLEQLSLEHPLPAKILEYRMLQKLRGTYVEALPKLVNPKTGRIHTSFNQAVAATGRLSSSEPNLQNIPIRTGLGRRIREGFVPQAPDGRFVSADYSQIELRILAHLSGDQQLKHAFELGLDIHRETAARIFGVPPEAVSPEMRRQAKAVNFGVIYGMTPFGLAKNVGISNADADRFITEYFAQYPGVQDWIDRTLEQAKRDGFVTTLLQRRRYIADLNSAEPNTRRAAQRAAINTPVQGTAADIIKLAMVRLDKQLAPTGARMLLQVHDELLVEVPESEVNEIAKMIEHTMENALELNVPVKVDVGIGKNWAEAH